MNVSKMILSRLCRSCDVSRRRLAARGIYMPLWEERTEAQIADAESYKAELAAEYARLAQQEQAPDEEKS